jgi:hypothetical protein
MAKPLKLIALRPLKTFSYDLDCLPLELRDLVRRNKAHKTIHTMQTVLSELLCSTYFLKAFFDKRPVISYHRSIASSKLQYYSAVASPKSHLRICMRNRLSSLQTTPIKHADWYVLRRTKSSWLKKTENPSEKIWIANTKDE